MLGSIVQKGTFIGLLLAIATFGTGARADVEKNILTGGPSGTYIQFGRDIAKIASECGIDVNARESAGSLENMLGVRKRPVTQFGIVQSDVLEYFRTYASDDPAIERAIRGVKIAFPLYNEEVHLLARSDIQNLSQLSGKRVAIGVQDSGTFLTASLVLDLAGVTAERITIGPEVSLNQLLAGEIDGFFYVAGMPTKIFQNDAIDGEAFHFVPMTNPVLQAIYDSTQIPAGTYPFQSEAVDAIAVKAVLMTYDFSPSRNTYHRDSCKAVSDIAHLIVRRFDELKETGHPKWNQVDLNDIPPGWEVGSCVNIGLDPGYRMSCGALQDTGDLVEQSKANAIYRHRICTIMGGC